MSELILSYGLLNKQTTGNYVRQFLKSCKNHVCIYCGMQFVAFKYHISENNKMYPCCQLCYMISHYQTKFSKFLIVCQSKISQLNIIKRTISFIRTYHKNPSITDIDPETIKINIFAKNFITMHINSDKNMNNIDICNIKLFYKNLNISSVVYHESIYEHNIFSDEEILNNNKYENDKNCPHKIKKSKSQNIQKNTIDMLVRWNQGMNANI